MSDRRFAVKFLSLLILGILSIMITWGMAYALIDSCTGEMSHYWKLDDAGPPYEDFYGTSNADCLDCPAAATGIINGAQQFDGISEVNVADDNTFDWGNTDSFSIEFWMKTDSGSTCSGNQVVVGRDDGTLHWWVGCSDTGGKATFYLLDTTGSGFSVEGSTDLTDGAWHHVVAVRDAGLNEIRIYVDGNEEGLMPATYFAGFDSFADLNIGWINKASGFHFDGTVDEVALYNRELTADEISQHYYDGIVGLSLGYCGCDSPIAVMPLGDSITHGLTDGISEEDYIVGYRQKLYLDLIGNDYNVNFTGSLMSGALAVLSFDIDHEGRDGLRDDEAAAAVAGVYDWLVANPADVVLLHIGTNGIDEIDGYSPDDVEDILDEIDRYEADSGSVVTVILARIIDIPYPSVTPFNDAVQAMAEVRIANGDRIILVDMENAVVYPDDYSPDGIHPNTVGYEKMADVWLPALETFLPVCTVPLQITSDPVIETGIGGAYSYNVNATSGHIVTYSLLTAPSGMYIDSDTGLIEWIPADGDNSVSVEAVNTGSATQDFAINVVEYPADMIHYWKLDDSNGSEYHDFYGSNNARCSACPAATAGKVDGGIDNGGIGSGYGAQQFDGIDDAVNVTDDDTFDWASDASFSIEFWMKTDSSSTCSGNQVIVGRDDSTLHWWAGCYSGGLAYFGLVDNNGESSFSVKGSRDLTDGEWHHVVAVRDAALNEIRIYVDGTPENVTSATYSQGFDSTVDLNIGYLVWRGTPGFYFDGAVDEVALYNRALTVGEISQHHNNGLSGNGYGNQIAYAPDIHVTDSILPDNDFKMDFGQITEFQSSAPETVTISNTGTSPLSVSDIQIAGTDAAEFELDVDGGTNPCTGTAFIITSGSCTVTVTFSPTSEGAKSANLEIASDDPDENEKTVIVALSGTGLSSVVYAPDINVTGSINFGNITELDSSAPDVVTISNTGTSPLSVSDIQIAGTDAAEFELDVDGGTNPCAGTAFIITSGSCTVTVTFSPTSTGSRLAYLAITSNDPNDKTVQVALSGTGLSSVVNNPPTAPLLVYPGSNQIDLGTTLDFSWNKSTDPDRDAVRYDLYICENDPTVSCAPIATEIAFLGNKGIYFAGTGSGLLLFGIVFAGSERGRRKIALLLVTLMIAATLLVACGSGGGGGDAPANNPTVNTPPPSGDITYTVSGLSSGTTYYWKVVAHDGNGNTVDSEIRSFKTQ